MLKYFYNALYSFHRVFSHHSTWLVLCMVIIGFIGTSEMVGVTSTQSKPSYFRGHQWGAIILLIGSLAAPFGPPLALNIHQGLIHKRIRS